VTKSKGVPIAVAQLVVQRDGWACVSCGLDISGLERGRDWSIHHRIPRGMGGSRDPRLSLPSNLVVLCGSGVTGCHGGTESYREGARARGLLLWRSEEPTEVPVEICTQRPAMGQPFETWPFLLDNDGGKTALEADRA
jgi:5-methylcytosine-specific restriction protein A